MTRLGRAAARIRTRASRDEGMTLAEVLVAITILGLSIAGITQALGTASLASADHRKQVNADIVVRAYAEAIKERVRARQDGYVPNVEATDTDGDGDPDTHPYGAAFDAAAFPGYTVSAVPVTEYQDVVDTKNVILILDRSGSIQDLPGTHEDEAGDVRRAAMAFINGLKNTGTHLALVSFSTQATYIPPRELDDGGVAMYDDHVYDRVTGGLKFGGGTNWEAGMDKAIELYPLFPGFPETPAPRVVFLTDGEPTLYVDDTCAAPYSGTTDVCGPGNTFSQRALDDAEAKADILKAEGSQVVAFGVAMATPGADDHIKELAWTEGTPGPFEWAPCTEADPDDCPTLPASRVSDLKTSHWTRINDFSQLEQVLAEAANQLREDSFSPYRQVTDLGTQRLTLKAASLDGRDTETLQIIVRKQPVQ